MAASRPKVKVIQQFETVSTTADVPDLNVLIVGPAYHIEDYSSVNKVNIAVSSDYGARNSPCDTAGDPTPVPTSIVITEPINNVVGAILDDSSVTIYLDDVLVEIAKAGDGAFVADTNVFTSAGSTFVTDAVKVGDRIVITDPGNVVTVERKVKTITSETELTLTRNLTTSGAAGINGDIEGALYATMATSGLDFRVERELQDKALAASFVTVAGQQTTVAAGLTLSDTTEGLTNAQVNYAKVYQQYRSLRQDLNTLDSMDDSAELSATLGVLDERNPLYVGAFVALQNTNSPVQIYGVTGDDINGLSDRLSAHTACRDEIESRKDVYCIVPLANETTVLSLWKGHVVALADPDKSNFRIAIGSSTLPTEKVIVAASTADVEELAGDPTVVFVDPGVDFVAGNVAVGSTLTITDTVLSGTYVVRRVLDPEILEVVATDAFATEGSTTLVDYSISGSTIAETDATIETRARFSVVFDADASFITDAVKVGDLIEIPANGGSDFTTALDSYTVAEIQSENRLKIDLGTSANTPLPYTAGGVTPATGANYRVSRALSKDDQVTELNAVTSSLSNSRLTMVWPDSCKVSGVKNESTGVQGDLPGYYMACAVGGMVAGNAPHQNFTNLGIGGIDSVKNSTGYFSNAQIDTLSSGGWYVMLQDSPNALPYSVHALTTDTGTLESGELMVVKNFDYVSIFFKGVLTEFLKGYNVLPETLDLISTALNSGVSQLKAKLVPKIGSPLLDANITTIQTVSGSADQVEIFMSVTLPRPLNEIGLYLVA